MIGLWSLSALFMMASTGKAHAFQVVIDPGHGGSDLGTTYTDGTHLILEKDITLKLARQIAYQLISRGIHVFLTRSSDIEVLCPPELPLPIDWEPMSLFPSI